MSDTKKKPTLADIKKHYADQRKEFPNVKNIAVRTEDFLALIDEVEALKAKK